MTARPTPDHHAIEDLRAICDLLEALAVANKATQFRIRRRSLALLTRIQRSTLDRLSVALSHTDASSIANTGWHSKSQGNETDA
jgi:hypothetical protein